MSETDVGPQKGPASTVRIEAQSRAVRNELVNHMPTDIYRLLDVEVKTVGELKYWLRDVPYDMPIVCCDGEGIKICVDVDVDSLNGTKALFITPNNELETT